MKSIKVYKNSLNNKNFKLMIGTILSASILVTFTGCGKENTNLDTKVSSQFEQVSEFNQYENIDIPVNLNLGNLDLNNIQFGANYNAILDDEKEVYISFEKVLNVTPIDGSQYMSTSNSIVATIYSYSENINERIDLEDSDYVVSLADNDENALVFNVRHKQKNKKY